MTSKVVPDAVDDEVEAAPALAGAEDGELSTAAKRKAAVRAIRRRERLLAVATVILYMLGGFIFYSFIVPQRKPTADGTDTELWTFVDCIYFAVTTTTTVGYGDLVPSDAGAKIFTIFFAFVGVGLVGLAMGMIAQAFVEWQQEMGRRAAKRMLEETLRATERARNMSQKIKRGASQRMMLGGGASGEAEEVAVTSGSRMSSWAAVARRWLCGGRVADGGAEGDVAYGARVLRVLLPLVLYVLLGWVLGAIEGWSFLDSMYVASVSITSVGFGDMSPQTQGGRGFAIFYLPVGVALAMNTIGQMAALHRRKRVTRRVPLKTLLQMDINGDGEIDEVEYLAHMLVAMKKVDKSTLDLLLLQFNSLDTSGTGVLRIDDLQARGADEAQRSQSEVRRSERNMLAGDEEASDEEAPALTPPLVAGAVANHGDELLVSEL